MPLLPLALAERLISTAFLLFTEVTKQQLYILAAPNLWDDSNLRNLCVSTRYMYHYLSLFCTLRFLHSSRTTSLWYSYLIRIDRHILTGSWNRMGLVRILCCCFKRIRDICESLVSRSSFSFLNRCIVNLA